MSKPRTQQENGEKSPTYSKNTKTVIVLFFTGGGRLQSETPHTAQELDERLSVAPDATVQIINSNDDPFIKQDVVSFDRKNVVFWNVVELNLEALEKQRSLDASGLILPNRGIEVVQ